MKKRVLFSEEEKVFVRSMVMENKDLVESKRSDAVSVIEKKKCWDKMTEKFNCSGRFPVRTAIQLRKLWENIKTRRKQELAAENRERMKIEGGPYNPDVLPDPELDALGVDIDLKNAVDRDTVAASTDGTPIEGESFPIVYLDPLAIKAEEAVDDYAEVLSRTPAILTDAIPSGSQPLDTPQLQPRKGTKKPNEDDVLSLTPAIRIDTILSSSQPLGTTPHPSVQPRKGPKKPNEDELLRIERNQMLLDNEKKLHEKKMEEANLRTALLRQDLRHGEELFKVKMEREAIGKLIAKAEFEMVLIRKEMLLEEKEHGNTQNIE